MKVIEYLNVGDPVLCIRDVDVKGQFVKGKWYHVSAIGMKYITITRTIFDKTAFLKFFADKKYIRKLKLQKIDNCD